MLKFIKENHRDKVLLGGIICVMLGSAIFLGATPRGQRPNNPGEAWILAVPFMLVGGFLLAVNWYWGR
jgi:hypothetical protein